MKPYLGDLHIHSALSPCGSLEMSAYDIITFAKHKGLDIIALTDHNCTRQVSVVRDLGLRENILVIPGLEVNTKEEIHCLVYFETISQLEEFQLFIDDHLPKVKNDPELFGDQVWANEDGEIVGEVEELLLVALSATFDEVCRKVRSMDGLVVPAHIDKSRNSILSQLGFIPSTAMIDAVEVSQTTQYAHLLEVHPEIASWSVMSNSDAHFLQDIGLRTTLFNLKEPTFQEVKLAMQKIDGRWMGC